MTEYFYTREDEEPVTYQIDKAKQQEVNETIFQYLRENGIAHPDDVASDIDKEEAALEMVRKVIELLEIELTDGDD